MKGQINPSPLNTNENLFKILLTIKTPNQSIDHFTQFNFWNLVYMFVCLFLFVVFCLNALWCNVYDWTDEGAIYTWDVKEKKSWTDLDAFIFAPSLKSYSCYINVTSIFFLHWFLPELSRIQWFPLGNSGKSDPWTHPWTHLHCYTLLIYSLYLFNNIF